MLRVSSLKRRRLLPVRVMFGNVRNKMKTYYACRTFRIFIPPSEHGAAITLRKYIDDYFFIIMSAKYYCENILILY